MLEAKPEKRVTMTVTNIRHNPATTVTVMADSISSAVELFLQDYLKNSAIGVQIIEHATTSRKI